MLKLNSKAEILFKVILCTFISLFFIFIKQVSANSIKNIDMDVYIDNNGNAVITEVWKTNLTEGTEGYKTYKNMGNSKISNFSVVDETGKEYETLSSWNTNASFNSKAYKSGVHYITDGVELCWGISSYGNKTYTLKYNVSNIVTKYTDTQGIYFNFINLDQNIANAKISIHSEHPFLLENSRIWGFGNDGTINFVDGNIVLESGGKLSSSQYMVALVRFESNLFNTTNISDKSFDDIYDSAMSDVNDSKLGFFSTIISILFFIILNPFGWILLLVVFLVLKKVKGKPWIYGAGKQSGYLDFGPAGNLLPFDDKIEYWREIPCNKDLERAYWVASKYNVVLEKTLKQGIIGAILLKWIKDGQVTVSKTRKGLFSFRDNNYAINLNDVINIDNKIENDLLKMLKSAAGMNNILEAKEFEKWCKKNYSKINNWFSTFLKNEQTELENQGLITDSIKETDARFGRKKTINVKKVSQELFEDAIHLKGLKKFLLDYSLMPEREYFEVHIWEEYLIFAQLLGIADKVEEQFSKIYPKFNEESVLNMDITTIAIREMIDIGFEGIEKGIESERRRAERRERYSGSDSDSGGGGSSYSGGGSSAGGSSGGGFR